MACNYVCHCNTKQSKGEYICCNCGTHVELDCTCMLPACPNCGNDTFVANNSDNYVEKE